MKKTWLSRCFQWKVSILATLIIAVAIILTLSRIFVVVLAHQRSFVEKWMSVALKQPVQIQSIKSDWAALDPGITFENVLVKSDVDQQPFIEVKRMTVSVDILRSLIHWKLLPGRLTIDGVNLDIDARQRNLQVHGILFSTKNLHVSTHSTAFANLVNWMLAEGNVDVSNANIDYHSKDKKDYFLCHVNFRVKNNFFIHRISGGIMINKTSPTEIRFAAKLKDIDFSDSKFNAKLYVRFNNIRLDQWANFSWLKPYIKAAKINDGAADLAIWADWRKTKFVDMQGRWHIKNVALQFLSSGERLNIKNTLGDFTWHPSSDVLNVQVDHVLFSLPREYSLEFLLKDLKAKLQWNLDDGGFHVYVPYYQFLLQGLKSRGEFYLTFPKSGKPTIDLLSRYRFPQFSQLSQLFPDRDSASSLNQWLRQAFVKGGIRDATIAYRGPIEEHPFHQHEAHLSAVFHVRDLDLSYYFGWPALQSLNSNIKVSNRRISTTFINANLDGSRVSRLEANVDDFFHPTLNISGALNSTVSNVYRFIQDSPLSLKQSLKILPVKGSISLKLQLQIDFSQPSFPVQSQGEADVMGNVLKFGVHTESSVVHLNLDGRFDIDPLVKQFPVKLLKGISGETDYHAFVDIYKSKMHEQKLNAVLETELRGITISGFPAFVSKKAETLKSFKLQVSTYVDKPTKVLMHYQHNVLMRLFAGNKNKHFKLLSGEIYVGKNLSPEYPAFPGFVIYGQMADLHWAKWKPFIMKFVHEKNGAIVIPKIFGLPLRYVEVHFNQLEAYHQTMKDLYFKLTPRPHDWMFDLKSPEVAGVFFIPNYSGGTWTGHFDYLSVSKMPKDKSKKKQKLKIDPRRIPPIDLEINDFHYGKADYGQLALRVQKNPRGILIKKFKINSFLFKLNLSGKWEQYHYHQWSAVSGTFETTDLGQLLSNFDVNDALKEGRGSSSFKLAWAGSLDDIKPEKLNGKITFDFHRGHILKMDKSKAIELSLGRLLNVFSISELPRHLSLHFSDITAKGLEFRTLKGEMLIKEGIAKLNDALLDGPVAKLKISGVINFYAKYYNLDISVSPYVTSSVPLIVGIAGGPIAGAIAWVVNKIATPEIGKAIGFVYHAKGSWDKVKGPKLPEPAETYDRPYKNSY